jgi:hypothetical protein
MTFQEWCEQNNSNLLSEWDYDANGSLLPSSIPKSYKQKVHWIGKCGHHWEAVIYGRINGNGCPVCRGLKPDIGVNDILTKRPDLVEEWIEEENGPILDYPMGSHKMVKWKCKKCGKISEAEVRSRTIYNHGCKYCNGPYCNTGVNDLKTKCPWLLDEWDKEGNAPVLPENVSFMSNTKYKWICKDCNHRWETAPCYRCGSRHSGCPRCAREYRISVPEKAVYHYVKKLFPDSIENYRDKSILGRKSIDVFIPSLNTGVEYDGKKWHQDERDNIKNQICLSVGIKLIRVREKGCPDVRYCTVVSVDGRDLDSLNDAIRSAIIAIHELNQLPIPESFDIDCERDLMYFLSQKYLSKKVNSLASRYPELLDEYKPELNDGLLPDKISAYCNNTVVWCCRKCHNTWKATVISRTLNGNGCSICNAKTIVAGFNDLATTHHHVAELWDYEKNYPLTPQQISYGNSDKHYWKCKNCGESWLAVTHSMTRPSATPYCEKCAKEYAASNRRKNYVSSGNSIQDTHPHIARQWHPTENGSLTPSDISIGYGKPIVWICIDCGASFKSIPYVVKKKKQMTCKSCSERRGHAELREKRLPTNCLAVKNEKISRQWHPTKNGSLTPSDVTYGEDRMVWWLCPECGYDWQATISSRSINGNGCPCCSNVVFVKGKNDLHSKYPHLAEQWDYDKNTMLPSEVRPRTSDSYWWICPICGDSWEARVGNRLKGHNCSKKHKKVQSVQF